MPNQRGIAHIAALLLLAIISLAIAYGVSKIDQKQFSFSKAASTDANADKCAAPPADWEHTFPNNKIKNPGFNDNFTNNVPNSWNSFGNATLVEETGYEKFDRASLRIDGNGVVSGGVYQVIDGLKSGTIYHAFYATAQKVSGESAGGLPTIREIGVDPSGGTDSSKVSNWGIRLSGGQQDVSPNRYGGWKTMGNKNNPVVTFQATGTKATIFLRVHTDDPKSGTSNTWLESVYMNEDCGSGTTVPAAGGGNTSGGTGSGASNPTAPGPNTTCDPFSVSMKIDPQTAKIGDTVTLNMTNAKGEGTTNIKDDLTGLGTCTDNLGLGANFDNPAFWPKVPKYKTCTVTATPFKWVHNWKNSTNSCSKYFDSVIGEQTSTALPSAAPSASSAPGTSAAPTTDTTPPTDYAKALKDKFGVTMTGFDNDHLKWAYDQLTATSNTKFPDLIKGVQIVVFDKDKTPRDNCTPVHLTQSTPEPRFKFIFTHELGHRIYACANPDSVRRRSDHDNVFNKEGPITIYSACRDKEPVPAGQPPFPPDFAKQEDYAEMIGYYLNPNINQVITEVPPACNTAGKLFVDGKNPFSDPARYPQHLNLAKQILNK